jgi:hypothetical protein
VRSPPAARRAPRTGPAADLLRQALDDEHLPGHRDLRHLKYNAGQRVSFHCGRHRQRSREVAETVGESMELEADSIGGEGPARQSRPFLAASRALIARLSASSR